jgi:hypothetical protein
MMESASRNGQADRRVTAVKTPGGRRLTMMSIPVLWRRRLADAGLLLMLMLVSSWLVRG